MEGDRRAAVADLRERLARLGGLGRPGGVPPRPAAPSPAGVRRTAAEAPAGPGGVPVRTVAALAQLGFHPFERREGVIWVRETTVDVGPLLHAAGVARTASTAALRELTGTPASVAALDRHAVLDIETLGLRGSGVIPFLVGLAIDDGATRLRVVQLLLVDLEAERALLAVLSEHLASVDTLVTYNGRSFDVPVLRARCVLARHPSAALVDAAHCDLLGPVRRLFRDRLRSCTLRQAEMDLLRMWRTDDVPGSEAPERYRAFLHRSDVAALAGVVEHNELDVCATAVLGARLVEHVSGRPVLPEHPADRYHLALHLERRVGRQPDDAVDDHLRAAFSRRVAPWDRSAGLRLARRRARTAAGHDEALAVLRTLVHADPTDLRAARALCILAERARHLDEAVAVADRALDACHRLGPFRLSRMRAAPPGGWAVDWEHRRDRLAQRHAGGRAAAV